ncbi:hypothetical protein LIER_43335 [Lithospermum erythrorhizon]|uniref:Uncharacterized protein n=1 Tax=Lithospermum erythrorhizon TaxID=34254 RepID=A0AAV3Q0Z6_LITER
MQNRAFYNNIMRKEYAYGEEGENEGDGKGSVSGKCWKWPSDEQSSMVVLRHVLLGSHFILLHMTKDIDFPISSLVLIGRLIMIKSDDNLITPYKDRMDLSNQIINASK